MRYPKQIAVIVFGLLASLIMAGCAAPDAGTNVYLVRHAEKVTTPDIGPDPDLTDTGAARAQLLFEILDGKNITRIHSSDYIRTRDTAKPLADAKGLEIEIYDPRDLAGLAAIIETAGGAHLVVGHSNTIAETVEALNGDGGTKISDDEYDRLYKVVMPHDGKVQTELTRFGDRFQPTEK